MAGGVTLMTVGIGLAAASIVHGGTVAVEVHEEDGGDVSVHAPAALIDLALLFVPNRSVTLALEHSDLARDPAFAQIEGSLPAVRDAWSELVDAPDFTVVEVKGDGQHLQVQKRGNHLVVHLDSDDGTFDVRLPLRTVSRVLHKL